MKRNINRTNNIIAFCFVTVLAIFLSTNLSAQSCADGSYSFDDDIAPILTAKCGNCHGNQGGYSVATYASTLAGGTNCGPAVTPGTATAAASSLIDKTQFVNGGANAACGANMPTSGTPLTAAEYLAIEAWIAAGAQESCPAPPTNDCCTAATPLPVDATNTCVPTLGTNVDATDCMEATPSCASYAGGDTWYEVTVPASGQLTIDLDVGDGTVTDMGMSWYSGTCGALVELECDDDDGPGLFPSITQMGLNPGDVIYVQVWEFGNNAFGDFNICAYEPPPPPPGDECADPIPYPGDAAAGICVTEFDFTIFGDSGMPSPTCDFGGDAVAFFSWTSPIITAAGDPLDLNFDDGDGQTNDCDIGIEVYEGDCTTAPVSNCLGNVSGMVMGLTQGTDYILLIYDDSVPDASCDFCLSVACTSPTVVATAVCQPGDDSGFYVEVDLTNLGTINTDYTVDIGGAAQGNINATGITTYGPFPAGTPVDVVLTGVTNQTCGATITGLIKDCNVVDGIAEGDTFCSTDAAVNATPNIPPDPGVTAVLTAEGAFDGEVGLGLYDGTWDDGSVIGLPPAGMGLFGTDTETSLEGATPNGGAGSFDPNVTTAGNFGDPAPLGASFTSGPLVDGNTYTLFIVDDFGDGWNDNNADLVDCEGNIILADLNQYIDAIAADDQDEVAWVTFVYTAPIPTITWSGAGAVTDDPDGMPGSGDEVYTFDPSMAGAAGCDPTDIPLTMSVLFCGETCDEVVTVSVSPPAQAPTIMLDDDVCNYTINPACADDVLDSTTTTAAPGEDPAAFDVMVTTAGGCSGTFQVDPELCPIIPPTCQGIDLAAGLPVVPTEVCSGATADICLTLIDAAEGLVVSGTIDGAPVTLTGVAGAGPNELCVTIDAPLNETCAPVDVVIQIDAITCTDGTDFPGILGGATLVDDLTGAGLNPLNVPVYPTLTVNTVGDGTCGMLTAELVAADGTVCAAAAGSPFTCAADGETLDYDFSADVAAFVAIPADCPLPTLTGTLTCANCAAPCDGLAADPGIVSPIELCDGDGPIDVCFLMVDATQGINFDVNIDGAPAGVIAGVAGANPNELCIQLPMVANQTCDLISFNITFNAITCNNGDAIAGPASPSLANDLNAGGGIVINVYPNLTVNTTGDAACGMLTATLDAADGTVCATAAGSPFTCMADGDALNYDFSGDVTFTPPAGCPLPTLSGALTCGNCDGASCTLMAPACNACPDPTCETSTTIDLMTGMELNDANEFSGAVPAVIPNYDITTNMGTLTLPMGGDQIFAVSGVTGLTLPNNISEVCLTMDINVISGEIPFLLEFRIENGVPGQQLQFNTMVDGLGMCSVGGNLADAVAAAGFTFMNGASYAVVAAIADFDGTPVAEDLVVEISNIMLTVCAPDPAIAGCTDPAFDNYDPDALCDDGSCSNDPTCPMCGPCETPNELPFAEIGGGDPDFSFAGADAFDDGNAMGIFAGGNNTFAGHGWFIDQSAIPADAMIEDYCIFGDFNVIADPADLPIVIEFRIENNGVGTFIEFNTTVTAPGPITIGGNLSTGTEFPPFDINGTAPTLVVAIAVPGLAGTPPPTGDIIVEYSNVYITDGTCNPSDVSMSTISTLDPTRICIDGVADPINVTIDVDGGGTGAWVITDAAGIILALPAGPPFDLDGAGAGQCLIWYVNFDDPAFMPMVGDDAAVLVGASTCAILSNPITVDRIEVSPATISSSPTSPITICTDDNMDEPIDVTIDDAGIGANGAWVITDAAGVILALPAGPPFVLDGAGVGNCLIWWVNFDDPAFAPAVGDDAPAIVAAATCAVLSNSIEVIREEDCGEPCMDAITGTVTTDETTCDLAGTMVEILDNMGNPVAGSPVTITADGSYNLPGPFPCGTYTALIVTGSAPQCYYDLDGDEGPIAFEVDGDGEADGANFSTQPQVPTLSQWGLITLALLMMCFGAIKIAYRKETLFYIK